MAIDQRSGMKVFGVINETLRLALAFTFVAFIIVTLILSEGYNEITILEKSKRLPHFTDNGDGTITDNWSKLIWLKNIDCIGKKTWAEALAICQSLANGICGLTDVIILHPKDW